MIAEGLIGRLRRPRLPRPAARARASTVGVGASRRHGLARLIPTPKVLIALVALVLALGGGWLWLRDSSLVAVKKVQITGVTGANAAQIRRALRASARTMTTLDVRTDQLRMAVSPYPIVKHLEVSSHFPHGLTIRVIEQNPVGAVVVDGRTIAVAADGTLLSSVSATGLPTIPLKVPPGGSRVTDQTARGAVVDPRRGTVSPAREHQPGDLGEPAWARRSDPQRPEPVLRRRDGGGCEVAGRDRRARRSGVGRSALHRRHRPGAAGGGRWLLDELQQRIGELIEQHGGRLRLNLSLRPQKWELSRYD